MGSFIEINDTLQLTKEQGFPAELDLDKHLKKPYTVKDFKEKIFEFKDKSSVRLYKMPPVRNFLVENRNGKYKIIYINTPEEMKKAHELIDRNKETQYFE